MSQENKSLDSLPIDVLVPAIMESLRERRNLVVVAPPGAGKTMRVPPALARALRAEKTGGGKSVILLQPRRVAARAAAARIAEEQGWRLGEEVGYQIRFDNRSGPKTIVRVVTEGILTRRLQNDPFIEDVGCVILDEFHERSIHTDLSLALLREVQQSVREDLRIVVMSATMQPGPVAEFLKDEAGAAPVLVSEGKMHAVALDYLERSELTPMWEQCAAAVRRRLAGWGERLEQGRADDPGHVLVFLPGIGEIRRTEALLREIDVDLHILHSSLSADAQDRAIRPGARRKLILATNIAETSITIDGVRTVIDSGWARVLLNDPRLGIDKLQLRRISRASANQRTGRAGRTAPGRCLRLWTRSEDGALEDHELPEIHRIDLAGTLLSLKSFGIKDARAFEWFDPPREEALARAEQLLRMLGALDDRGLTKVGEKLAGFPLHPRIGRMLLAGAEQGLLREAATLAALLSEKDIVYEGGGRRRPAAWEGSSDLLDRLELVEHNRDGEGVDPLALRAVERTRDELMEIARRMRSQC